MQNEITKTFKSHDSLAEILLRNFIVVFTLILSAAAILKTRGVTIFLPGLFSAIFLQLNRENWNYEVLKKIGKGILFCISMLTIYNLKFYNNGTLDLIPVGDHSYYAQVSAYINYSGNESYYFDYTNTKQTVPLPYHYGESWITIIAENILNLGEFYTQEMFTTPFLISLGIYFIYLSAFQLTQNHITSIVISIASAFLGSYSPLRNIPIPFLTNYLDEFQVPINHYPKFAFSFFCSTLILYSFILSKYSLSTNTLLATTLSFLGNLSFGPILVLFILFHLYNNRKHSRRTVIYGISCLLFFCILYLRNGLDHSNFNPVSKSFFSECISISKYTITFINVIGKTILQLTYLYSPYLLLLLIAYYLRNRHSKNTLNDFNTKLRKIYPILILPLGGIFCWAVIWYSMGSISLFIDGGYIIFRTAIIFISITFLSASIKTHNIVHILFKCLLLILSFTSINEIFFTNNFSSKQYISHQDLLKKLPLNATSPFIYIRDYQSTGNIYENNLLAFTSIDFLTSVTANQQGIFVNIASLKRNIDCLTSKRVDGMVRNSVFYTFAQNNILLEDTALIKQFISNNNIAYIFSDKQYTPSNAGLLNYISKDLFYSDPSSNIYIYKIRKSAGINSL